MGVPSMQLLAAGGGTFSPLDLPGLAAWWDASDDASFTYSSGTIVSTWADLSPNGYNLTTVSGSPNRNVTVNGLDAVAFSTSPMTAGDVLDLGTDGITYLSVHVGVSTGVVFGKYKVNPATGSWLQNHETTVRRGTYKPSGAVAVSDLTDTDYTNPHVQRTTIDRVAGTIVMARDGAARPAGSFTPDSGTSMNISTHFFVGGLREVNDTGFYPGYYFSSTMAEIIVCKPNLGANDAAAAEAYLKAKWGTP